MWSCMDKVKKLPRNLALKRGTSKSNKTERPVFAVTYDPRLPSITALQAKHWRSMTKKNKYLSVVFPNPQTTAYKRQQNLRSMVIRSAVARDNIYPKRK